MGGHLIKMGGYNFLLKNKVWYGTYSTNYSKLRISKKK